MNGVMASRARRNARRTVGIALALALMPAAALAEFPGEKWHVTQLKISVAPEAGEAGDLSARVRQGLSTANQTYFYGEHPVRMEVRILSEGAMSVSVRDQLTGALLGHTGPVELGATPGTVSDLALAWMDGLECSAPGCSSATGPVVPAVTPAAPTAQPTAAQPETGTVALSRTGPETPLVPVPVDAPRGRLALGPEQGEAIIARNPLPAIEGTIRLSRLSLARVGQFSYNATDPVVTGQPRSLAPTANQPTATPQAESSTVVGRFFTGIGRFFGLVDEPERAAAPVVTVTPAVAAPATQPGQPVTRVALSNPVVAAPVETDPAPTFRLPPPTAGAVQPGAPDQRVAALVPAATPGGVSSVPPLNAGIVRVPSAGLGLPAPRADADRDALVTPIRVAPAARQAGDPLSVRLDPQVLALAGSSASVGTVLGGYGNPQARLRLVAGDGNGTATPRGADRILSARGLTLASDVYAKAERVYWNGDSGSRGYWVNVPGGVPSRYVLIASARGSVIADVHAQGGSVQVSDAVAAAIGMVPGAWSDIQVIAVRGAETLVRRRTRDRAR